MSTVSNLAFLSGSKPWLEVAVVSGGAASSLTRPGGQELTGICATQEEGENWSEVDTSRTVFTWIGRGILSPDVFVMGQYYEVKGMRLKRRRENS